jgi:uncharacterized protein YerC
MPQVSRRPVQKEIREKMFNALFESIMKVSGEKAARDFLGDLFTPTEKIMIAKRFSAALLLYRGYNYRHIADALKLSPTTINTIQHILLERGDGYRSVFRMIEKSSKISHLLDALDTMLGATTLPVKNSHSGFGR